MKYPKILTRHFHKLQILNNKDIICTIEETVTNGMTVDMLVGNVTNIILSEDKIQRINDGSYNFKKSLMIRVKLCVEALGYAFQETKTTQVAKDGSMYISISKTVVGEREASLHVKEWFRDATEVESTLKVKGSNKILDNNSKELLELKRDKTFRVKEIAPEFIDLYAVLLFEANKGKVTESPMSYFDRLQEVVEETKFSMGYEYTNCRKLDSNTRNYPLNRYGFAVEYGDSFEKFMIEPVQEYLVTRLDVDMAIEYIENEFKCEDHTKIVLEARKLLSANVAMLEDYNKGLVVDFTISHKDLGKYLHIVDVYMNIIDNVGERTSTLVSSDFTNSGGIMASNQFGDTKFLNTMNLLGGDEVFDTHQAIADYRGIERDDAKLVMQSPNHGGTVPDDLQEMVVDIFGDNYKYIRMIAEYGTKLAKAGHTNICLTRPDGVKAFWSPYVLDCSVSMEDGSSISAIMPYGGNGQLKHLGLAVTCLHSADAFVENYIDSTLIREGIHIKTTLDNFYHRPSLKPRLVDLTFEALDILRGWVESQLVNIELTTGVSRGWTLPERPDIVKSSNIF